MWRKVSRLTTNVKKINQVVIQEDVESVSAVWDQYT